MKITCTKCGKRFDGEENLYICPKCNHYHSQVGARDKMTVKTESSDLFRNKKSTSDIFRDGNILDMIDDFIAPDDTSNDEPEFIQTLNGEQKVYTVVPEKKSESTFEPGGAVKKIGLAICIVIGFILFITSTLGEFDAWSDDSDSWDSGWESSYSGDMQVDFGQPMEFETFTVNVEGSNGEPEFDGLEAADGWKLVQINFETESPYEYESGEISTDVALELSEGEEYDYPQDVYHALYEDEIASDRPVEEELREAGIVAEAHYSGEYFWIFEVPEDVSSVNLKITSFTLDDEEDWSYSQDEIIRMPIEL